jgi:hypothetical protein
MLPTKIWFILISGFRREDSNVKNKQKTGDGRHVMAKNEILCNRLANYSNTWWKESLEGP